MSDDKELVQERPAWLVLANSYGSDMVEVSIFVGARISDPAAWKPGFDGADPTTKLS